MPSVAFSFALFALRLGEAYQLLKCGLQRHPDGKAVHTMYNHALLTELLMVSYYESDPWLIAEWESTDQFVIYDLLIIFKAFGLLASPYPIRISLSAIRRAWLGL